MAHCILTTSPEYISLKESLPNTDERFLKAAIGLWQEQNGLDSFPTKQQLTEFLRVKSKKTEKLPSKFDYEDRVSYITALLNWEVNRGIFYRDTLQQAKDLKESLSTSINPQNISITSLNTTSEHKYKVYVKKPKIESKTEQQTRLAEYKNTETLKWWNSLTPEQRQSELSRLENMSDDEIDYNSFMDTSKVFPSVALYDDMEDKPIKDESDVMDALKLFSIVDNEGEVLNIVSLVDFNSVFLEHFSKPLVELSAGSVRVIKDTLKQYNESKLQPIIKADLDIIFAKKIKGYDERETTNEVDTDLEDIFNIDEGFRELATEESQKKFQVALNSATFKIENFRKRLAKIYSDIEITSKQIIDLQSKGETTSALQDKLKILQDKQINLQTLVEEQEGFISELKKSRESNSLMIFFDMAEKELEQLKAFSERSELTADEIDQAERIYSLWSAVGDRTLNRNTNSHPIFTKKELENDEMFYGFTDIAGKQHKGFANIKEEMGRYMNTISDIKANMVVEAVKKELHQDGITKESLLRAIKDVPYIKALSYSISRVDDELMLSIYKMMRTSIIKIRNEGQERMESLDAKIKAVEEQFGKNWMDMFIQKFEDGSKTGDLVDMYVPEYFKEKAKAYLSAKEAKDYSKYIKFLRDNENLMDINILFPEAEGNYNEDVQNAYIDEIKKKIGEYNFEYFYNMQERLIEKYKAAKFAKFQYIDTLDINEESKTAQKKAWEYWNSPYQYIERLNNNKVTFSDGMFSRYNVSMVANSKWYDPNYTKVISNKTTADLYTEITNLLRDLKYMIPENERSTVKRNTLPDIRKKVIGAMFNGNSTFGMDYLLNKVVDLTTQDTSIKSGLREEKDIVTGKIIRNVRTPSTGNREVLIKAYIKEKTLEYKTETNKQPTDEQKYRWRLEAIKNIAEEKSYDLGNILKLYMVQVLSYKHKSDVENLVNFSAQLMIGRNQKTVDSAGNIQEVQGTKQLTEMLEYALDVWKGYPIKAVEASTNVKLLSSVERKKKREYSYLLDRMRLKLQALENSDAPQSEIDALNKDISDVEEKMNSLGSNVTGSQVADAAMSWYTLLGMGWNAIAGVVNLAIGFLENTVRAADGRYFTTKDLFSSYMHTFSLIGKQVASTPEGRKIYNFNKKFDIVNKAMNELYNFENNDWITFIRKKSVLLNPMVINEVTELQNQMPIIRAYLLHKKAFDNNGNETNYWDAFNEDMTIKEGYKLSDKMSNEDALIDMELSIRDLIKRSHGDYDQHNAKLYKKYTLSRAMYQFRGWMPEGIASRFGKEEEVNLLGETVKGRYRSYAKVFKATTLGDEHYTAMNNVMFAMKQILRKMLFQKTQFNDRMSEVDAANMRANLQELFILMSTLSLTLMLTSLVPDSDDRKKYRINILLNVLQRTQTDILMYINPIQYQKISQSFIPVLGLINSISKAIGATGDYLLDTSNENFIKMVKADARNLPLATQVVRVGSYTDKVFNK